MYLPSEVKALILSYLVCAVTVLGAPYSATWQAYNLNSNPDPTAGVLDFYSDWPGHVYHPSPPQGWRSLPTYTVLPDRWMNGDPTLDSFFGTDHEWDITSNQLRAGGDLAGLASNRSLDYLQSMGIGCIYIAGSPFVNMPWGSDGYSPLDQTLLDPHYGTLEQWRSFVEAVHGRGMYLIVDLTVATQGDLLGAHGFLNESVPYSINEYDYEWKRPPYASWNITEYLDFSPSNEYNASCEYPPFWDDSGLPINQSTLGKLKGCYASEFDQYGDTEAFGVHPEWQRQITKFASVQDRLREWNVGVAAKLEAYACLTIAALDVDGIRVDKTLQMTLDFVANWAEATRTCARAHNKQDFFIPGELVAGNEFSGLYLGRGRTPSMASGSTADGLSLTNANDTAFLRPQKRALDAAAFHYSIYRSFHVHFGLQGYLEAPGDLSNNFIEAYNQMLERNDMLNANTGVLDPRHQFGVTNQDVFRWPAITNGVAQNKYGLFITHLLLAGIPLSYFGEEQGLHLFDSQSSNYLFGRQPMTSNQAWQSHGCYKLGALTFADWPIEKGATGCLDPFNSLDHFRPHEPTKLLIAHFNYLRKNIPALQDGLSLTQLGEWTTNSRLLDDHFTPLPVGLWSAVRSMLPSANSTFPSVHLLYTNNNISMTFQHDCADPSTAIITPFPINSTVRNLLPPYETYVLSTGPTATQSCLGALDFDLYGFKALVLAADWIPPLPAVVGFLPGHDIRLLSQASNATTLDIGFHFSVPMDCTSILPLIKIQLVTSPEMTSTPTIDPTTIVCSSTPPPLILTTGSSQSAFSWAAKVRNATDGVYQISITLPGSSGGVPDHFLLRKGKENNPIVFPQVSGFSAPLLQQDNRGGLALYNKAAGADMLRWSTDFRQTWSAWQPYQTVVALPSGTFKPSDHARHIDVQYYSTLAGSSAHAVSSNLATSAEFNRTYFPELLGRGEFNDWGYDGGVDGSFVRDNATGFWSLDIATTWPAGILINLYKAKPDWYYGDVDGDYVLDKLSPNSLAYNRLNLTTPPAGALAYRVFVDEATLRWWAVARGHSWVPAVFFALFIVIPVAGALLSVGLFQHRFYAIVYNRYGFNQPKTGLKRLWHTLKRSPKLEPPVQFASAADRIIRGGKVGVDGQPSVRKATRTVLIATMEWEIFDWKLKVRIGGLGVMSSLMGNVMEDCDLIWVCPKVGDVEFPPGTAALPIQVTVFGETLEVETSVHLYKNITYVLIDSPVFRMQTKGEPYPSRMDDVKSSIYYSIYNQCIAECLRRTPVDIYHINDYHGALAPLYLLPQVQPVCLSLHNAEFQGLWPLRNESEVVDVCRAFNLSVDVCRKYIQLGNSFNLLHAAASFISKHQDGAGVVGVSKSYGKRSHLRYPALWQLKDVEALPNPDPTDLADIDATPVDTSKIPVNMDAESLRSPAKLEAQKWASLDSDPRAELFVFVGRWSKQKGIDLIADIFGEILEEKPKVQLIAVGPAIDLYGQLAAQKLAALAELYPGRVFSRPEFTLVPPCVYTGSDFALMPSRDEPFGLVAIEFGRKGALGVGSYLGGLGLMPGWWFPVESTAASHMLDQLKKSIYAALGSSRKERALLRARSAVLRFPTIEWRQKLDKLHRQSIAASRAVHEKRRFSLSVSMDISLGSRPSSIRSRTPLKRTTASSSAYFGSSAASVDLTEGNRSSSAPTSPRPQIMPHYAPSQRDLGLDYSPLEGSGFPFNSSSILRSPQDFKPAFSRTQSPSATQLPTSPSMSVSRQSIIWGDTALATESSSSSRRPSIELELGILSAAEVEDRFEDAMEHFPDSPMEAKPIAAYPMDDRFADADDDSDILSIRLPSLSSGGAETPSTPISFPPSSSAPTTPLPAVLPDENKRMSRPPFRPGSTSTLFDFLSEKVMGSSAFEDTSEAIQHAFRVELLDLSSHNSAGSLCIDRFLAEAETKHYRSHRMTVLPRSFSARTMSPSDGYSENYSVNEKAFEGSAPLVPRPSRVPGSTFIMHEAGGWPIYTIILAFGQIISASSFQLTILTGSSLQGNTDLYILGGVFGFATLGWYWLLSKQPAYLALSGPFFVFALAFFLVGAAAFSSGTSSAVHHQITLAASCFYSIASASYFALFGLNFGLEAGSPAEVPVARAWIVQGLQSIWTAALWFFGFKLANRANYFAPKWLPGVTTALAIICVACGVLLYCHLPSFYRSQPSRNRALWGTLLRRRLVVWFIVSGCMTTYWLSQPYGRNWSYLWTSNIIPIWATCVLLIFFFVFLWSGIMFVLYRLTMHHSWVVPMLACGLLAPRWAQICWATSGVGINLTFAGAAGPFLAIGLWLLLGVFDALQGVGTGLMLIQTLSRQHVVSVTALSQIVGAIVTILARATAPDRLTFGTTFPNFAIWNIGEAGGVSPLSHAPFWICLLMCLSVPVGFFWSFRREQMAKP